MEYGTKVKIDLQTLFELGEVNDDGTMSDFGKFLVAYKDGKWVILNSYLIELYEENQVALFIEYNKWDELFYVLGSPIVKNDRDEDVAVVIGLTREQFDTCVSCIRK